MRIKVTAQNAIRHSEYGLLEPGKEYDVASLSGIREHVKVVTQEYDTKVIVERPTLAAGIPSSASPAGQASPEQTVTRRRRGRRSKQGAE
jgi:hypothetical protein